MRIGLCTTDFHSPLPADVMFAKIADMGYSCVQLAFCTIAECAFTASDHIEIPGAVSPVALSAISKAAEKHGVAVAAVNGTWNMAHPDLEMREEGLRRMEGFLRAVKELGCGAASLCSGTRSRERLWRFSSENTLPEAWADMEDSMKRSAEIAERVGVTLAIETEASNIINTPEKARAILDAVGSERLRMILDCANLFGPGEASEEAMRPAIDRAIANYGQDVVLAHGKDIQPGEGIRFCGTGFGIVDFPYMLRRLHEAGYKGDMLLHGIYREEDMPGCFEFMQKCVRDAEKEWSN